MAGEENVIVLSKNLVVGDPVCLEYDSRQSYDKLRCQGCGSLNQLETPLTEAVMAIWVLLRNFAFLSWRKKKRYQVSQ
jgi:hypothetical protein